MNKVHKLSEICSDIVVIQGFDHKYKYLIKNRLDLFAIIKGNKLNNIKFMEGSSIKLINKFYNVLKNIDITKQLIESSILFIYEKNGKFFKVGIIDGINTEYTEYSFIFDTVPHAPILNEYFDSEKNFIINSVFTSYDTIVYNTDDKYRQNLKFELIDDKYNEYNEYFTYNEYFARKFNDKTSLFPPGDCKHLYYKFKHITPNSVDKFLHKIDETIEISHIFF